MKILLLIILVIIGNSLFAQATNWDWAKKSGALGAEYGHTIDKDGEGNVYVAGVYNGSFIAFGTDTLLNSYGYGMYLVKYDVSGNIQWARGIDSVYNSMTDYFMDIAIDMSGNIYFAGSYITPSLIKYDSAGNVLWSRDNDGLNFSIDIDASNNVYVAGSFRAPVTFGNYTLHNSDTVANPQLYDIFIVKYDELGNVLWAKSEGSLGQEEFACIKIDDNGNIFLSGRYGYSETITFGTYTLTNSDSNNTYYGYDVFIVKYDNNGNILWAKGEGAIGYNSGERINGLATDSQGNIYAIGQFNTPSITFDSTTLLNVDDQASGTSYDAFIVKYDPQGTLIWVISIGDNGMELGDDIITDAYDNVYITGIYSNSITFGETTLPNNNFGATKIFVAKYDLDGNVLWANYSGGTCYAWTGEIAADDIGNVYVTGFFSENSIIFGSDTLYDDTGRDMFLAKLNPNNLTVATENINDINDYLIYPNPSNGIFNIKTLGHLETIEIYNSMGELLFITKNSNQINLQNYPEGLYLARINRKKKCYKLISE
jgi:hypothetical protein